MSLKSLEGKVSVEDLVAIVALTQFLYSAHNVVRGPLACLDGKAGKAIKDMTDTEILEIFGTELTQAQVSALATAFSSVSTVFENVDSIIGLLPANDLVEEID